MIINFKDLNKKYVFLKEIEKKIYDIIIIGTGPAAYVMYEALNKKNKKILVVEKGDINPFPNIRFKKTESLITNENYNIKKNSRVSALGGTGNIWAGVTTYLENLEMRSRWKKNKNLWPISHKEILNCYKELNKKYFFEDFSFDKEIKKKDRDNKFIRKRSFVSYRTPFRFNNLDHYKEADLLINTKVKYLNTLRNRALIELDDNKIKIYSKKILVCCGGLETNFLILRSINNKRLKNAKNKSIVGKYFMDHPKFQIGITKPTKKNIKFLKEVSLLKDKSLFKYKGISLSEKIQVKKKLLNTYVRFEKYLLIELLNKLKKEGPKLKYYFQILKLYCLKIFGKDYEIEKYKITMYNEMVPVRTNKIVYKIKNKKEKFLISYKFSKKEFQTINYLINVLKKYLKINLNTEFKLSKKNIENLLMDSSHHMGGTIMGSNKKNSFVNKNLQIHGINNIHICSTSVFPSSGSLNPTMTLCSLAIKIAKYLNKK